MIKLKVIIIVFVNIIISLFSYDNNNNLGSSSPLLAYVHVGLRFYVIEPKVYKGASIMN